jgi:hypothetical protein
MSNQGCHITSQGRGALDARNSEETGLWQVQPPVNTNITQVCSISRLGRPSRHVYRRIVNEDVGFGQWQEGGK